LWQVAGMGHGFVHIMLRKSLCTIYCRYYACLHTLSSKPSPPPFRKALEADCTNGESFFPLILINITFEKKAYVEDIFKKRKKIKGII